MKTLYLVRNKYGDIEWFEDKPVWNEFTKTWKGLECGELLFDDDSFLDHIQYGDEPHVLELKFI